MENISKTFDVLINSFTNVDELQNFVTSLGLQELPSARFRLFQLRNPEYGETFVNEELSSILQHLEGATEKNVDFELALEYVKEQDDVEKLVRSLCFDNEMNEITKTSIEDNSREPTILTGGGEEPKPGPSHRPKSRPGLQYTIRKKSEKTYAKYAAVDRTYQVKVNAQHQGQKLQDVRQGLHQMFDEVLGQARGDLQDNDLGRVVLHHESLNNPIIVPLQPWEQLNANTVMKTVEKVLNSNEALAIDESFDISIGSIDLPKGSGGPRRRITKLKGNNNSLQLKTSIVTIENEDMLCMARAIVVSWAKLKRCSPEEWKEIAKNRQKKSNLQLILQHQKVPESYRKKLGEKKRDEQRQLAVAISHLAGIPLDRPASLNDVSAFEDVLGVRIMVISARMGNKFITSPCADKRPCIYIYLVNDDHFHAITSITGFFSSNYFCHRCLKHYDHKERHECKTHCIICKSDGCLITETPIDCINCNMTCRSPNCYKRHLKIPVHNKGKYKGKPRGPSQCHKWWKCPTCYKVVNREKRQIEDHQCGEHYCSSCQNFVLEDHLCYIRAISAKEEFKSKFIFFDFECTQDEIVECQEGYIVTKNPNCRVCKPEQICKSCSKCRNCKTSSCGKATHRPNFVVAHSVCPECINKPLTPKSVCKKCGTRCEECDSIDLFDDEVTEPCHEKCGYREVIFEGEDTAERFGEWLFSDQHRHFKVIAHNMKGYDGYFLLEYLINQSVRPDKIIYNGSKIMYMTLEKELHIKVLDSLNFLPMKLSKLPEAFGLQELKKGWFPHFFNTRENQQYVGPYPEPKFYGVDFMSTDERKECLQWHQTKEGEQFDFRKEMLEYCRSDVDILRQSCLKFRQLLMSATGKQEEITNDKGKLETVWVGAIDPFDSVTIASVCMNMYRTKFLEEKWRVKLDKESEWTSAQVIDGELYVYHQNKWIKEVDLKDNKIEQKEFVSTPIAKIPPNGYRDQYSKVSIQWLEWIANQEEIYIQHALNVGEKRLTGTRYKLDGYCVETNTAYEFHGCVFHGCPNCFPEDREGTFHPLTEQSMKELYALTMKKKHYIERQGIKYVCIWEHQFHEQLVQSTEMKIFIDNLDMTDRLDPRESFFGGRTNASQLYYHVQDDETIRYVDFTSLYPWVNKYCEYPVGHPKIIVKDFQNISQYFGIAKVKILPPTDLYHPVLPYRSNGKLKFSLCKFCADNENQDDCTCSDEKRTLIGTWCTPELQTAVRLGYKIIKIYEVYHWEETTKYDSTTREGGLFAKYINTFLKFKQEASGRPDWIKNEEDVYKYIQQYFEKEGVTLKMEEIVKNPGLRALAKLCLNSFWGKFGQQLNMRQTNFFHNTEVNEFFQLFSDKMKQPQNFHILSNEILQMEWTYKNACQPEDNKTNIYLATFTTCWARLKLYSILEVLNRRVLYYDTDSVIYVNRKGQYDPPLGDYLGELTDELKRGEHIVEFVSGGPKNYAYKTNKNNETCKVRGFTLNFTNSQLINFKSVQTIVTNPECCKTIVVTNPSKICRDKRKRKLVNREEKKSYQMVYTKRRVLDNYDTVPYGYR